MSCCNKVSTVFTHCRRSQPFNENTSQVEIVPAPQDTCAKLTRWGKWIVTAPFTAAHALWNSGLMGWYKEIHNPVKKQVSKGNVIHFMPGVYSFHIVSSPRIMHVVLKQFRNNPHGFFQGKLIETVLLPLIKDLFENPKDPNTKVTRDDFLFTAVHSKENSPVRELRSPFETFIGPDKVPYFEHNIVVVMDDLLKWLAAQEKEGQVVIRADKLTEIFTVAVKARLFLDLPGAYQDYQKIAEAVAQINNFQLVGKWSNPTPQKRAEYQANLRLVRTTIESCKGPFVDHLNRLGLSPLRQKSTLFLLFLAGSDTTGSTLEYWLWQQGRCPIEQQKLYQDITTAPLEADARAKRHISETLRMFSPADLISRYANQDMVIKITNKDETTWDYFIWKGQGIMLSQFLAGRDPKLFPNPHSFDPDRFLKKKGDPHPNKPFSEGPEGCPGRSFARLMMSTFMKRLVAEYEIFSSPNKPDLDMTGFVTTKAEPVTLTLMRRKKSDENKKQD